MPRIYLSPSTQEGNFYVTGNTEEYWMNEIADAMEPYLLSSGIQFTRNTPQMTAGSSITASNNGNYDLHLAIHSNASPPDRAGQVMRSEVYYFPGSTKGFEAASIIANNLRSIYPGVVVTLPNTRLGELRRVRAPAAYIEIAYHDNINDANFITNNIDEIAQNIVLSLTEYFGIPFITPTPIREGVVTLTSGSLNIRAFPTTNSAIKGTVPNGSTVTVFGEYGEWLVVAFGDLVGYANRDFITIV